MLEKLQMYINGARAALGNIQKSKTSHSGGYSTNNVKKKSKYSHAIDDIVNGIITISELSTKRKSTALLCYIG